MEHEQENQSPVTNNVEGQGSAAEIAEKIKQLKDNFINCRSQEEREKNMKECRELSAAEIARATTYEEFKEAHWNSLHPDDKKSTYLKMIELAPSREITQQLVYHAMDEELKEAARRKLESFK